MTASSRRAGPAAAVRSGVMPTGMPRTAVRKHRGATVSRAEPFDPSAYGKAAAGDYDALYRHHDPRPAVEALVQLADGGPVLEMGIGTGRLALPLRERGLAVHGIEGSAEMVAVLRRKPGGAQLPVVIGNFADTSAGDGFAVVLLAFNTIFALPSQDSQVACHRNAARHLRPGGCFVLEAWVPDPGAFRQGRAVRPVHIADSHVELEVAEIHPADQTMRTVKVHCAADGLRLIPANHRYAWPAELDLMAAMAGLELEHRWAGWAREPFQDSSTTHVSVWRKPTHTDG